MLLTERNGLPSSKAACRLYVVVEIKVFSKWFQWLLQIQRGDRFAFIVKMTVSMVISTRNRLGQLRGTCEALRRLNPLPLEIIITADGCTDGTAEFVKSALPEAKLL